LRASRCLTPTAAMAANDPKLLAALDLMRRMPPSRMERSLEELIDLCPDMMDDLLSTIDQPLQLAKDSGGNSYLLCDYNRDQDSYRSPWTNTYDPPLDDGVLPSAALRAMESMANDVFEAYREMYYESGSASSVYFWDLEDGNFAACVLFKKDAEKHKKLKSGSWDSIHVVEISPGAKMTKYKLTSTIILRIDTAHQAASSCGSLNLSGSLTRQNEVSLVAKDNGAHVANMGRLIEDMENRMRDTLQITYFGKTKNVVNGLYKAAGGANQNMKDDLARALQAELKGR